MSKHNQPPFDEKFSAFLNDAEDWVAQQYLPGAQCLVAEPSRVQKMNLGFQDIEHQIPVSDETLYRLASATKVFVSVGFLRLVQSRQVSLSDPVSSVLPEYDKLSVFDENGETKPAQNPMLMVDLLRHSCGYGYGDETSVPFRNALMTAGLLGVDQLGYDHWQTDLNLRDWAAALSQVPLEDEPGTRVKYGLGHDIAGAVIEAVSGRRLDAFMRDQVFEPLGLENTFFVVPENRIANLSAFYSRQEGTTVLVESAKNSAFLRQPVGFSGGGGWDMLGNGGLTSNVGDFCTLLQMIVSEGKHHGEPFLEPEHAALLCKSQTHSLAHNKMLPGCEYSFGVADVIDPIAYETKGTGSQGPVGKMWWGGSTNTYFYYVPNTIKSSKKVGVMLSNILPFGYKGAVFKFGRLSS